MSNLTPPEACASDLVLDRALGGELGAGAERTLRDHMAACAHCQTRFDDFARQREAFLASTPSFTELAAHVDRQRPRRSPRHTRTTAPPVLLLATAAAAAAAVILVQRASLPRAPRAPASSHADGAAAPDTRSKGRPHLGFFIKRGVLVTPGEDGAEVQPGDRLRFTYTSSTPRYFALFGLDARDASTYFPSGGSAVRVRAGGEVALDFGVELDAQPGDERMFGVFCDGSFDTEAVRLELAARHELRPPAGCTVDAIRLRKEPPR